MQTRLIKKDEKIEMMMMMMMMYQCNTPPTFYYNTHFWKTTYNPFIYTHLYTARLSASNCAWSISFAFDVDVFVFDVISLAFSFCPPPAVPVGDVSDDDDDEDDDAVTDVILFSCIFL